MKSTRIGIARRPLRRASWVWLLGIASALIATGCGPRTANLDPSAPDSVGAFHRDESLADETGGTWNFSASIDAWTAHYVDPGGRRLTLYAFLFPTPTVANDTYETSRAKLKGGGGNFTKTEGTRVAGELGMRMSDAAGDYFEFQRGCWVIILEGPSEIFGPAIHAIRWAPAPS